MDPHHLRWPRPGVFGEAEAVQAPYDTASIGCRDRWGGLISPLISPGPVDCEVVEHGWRQKYGFRDAVRIQHGREPKHRPRQAMWRLLVGQVKG